MKTPPPHGLVCAAGVFVLGWYCPYSGESCRCPEARRAVCQRRRKCHLPGTYFARGDGEVHLLYCLSAGQHSPIQAVDLCQGSPAAARKSAGQCASLAINAIFPAHSLPREYGTALLPLRSQTKTPPSSGENPAEGGVLFFIRLRRNSPLRCWSGTRLRPDFPAR